MNKLRLLIFLYILTIFGLFFYSFTQIDLSLTLSRLSIWQTIEKGFQYIGYFQRPLSTVWYVVLILLLFATQTGFLLTVQKNMISRKQVWVLIIFTAVVLAFSYNAFSYDLFNYIFDAKIVTHYHLNPYQHKALDFPQDPMLSFMHWTQRIYPYGPLWLFLTIPFSFLGGQIFLVTFYLFKLIGAGSYLGTAYFLEKIAKKTVPQESLFPLALFAFSPFVIIEGIVSAHNDMVMIFLSTLALYLLLSKRYVVSLIALIASVGVKFATAVWLPLWVLIMVAQTKRKQVPYRLFIVTGILLSLIPIVLATLRTNFQPWYFLYILPFAALTKKYVAIPFSIFSFFALLQYVPFLYTGNWNPPIPMLLNQLSLIGVGLSLLVLTGLFFYNLAVAKKG